MILLDIIIQLIVFTLLAMVIALPLAGIVCWRSKKNKKRNAILTFISPFVFMYTFYFGCLIGGFNCSSVFGTGCGIDGYYHTTLPNGYELKTLSEDSGREYFTGYIRKDGKDVIEWVTKIKVSGDSICGEQYFVNEAPGSEYYFVIDTKSGSITQYKSFREVNENDPTLLTGLTLLEAFYYKSWSWAIPLGIIAFVISLGVVSFLWFIVGKIST